MKEPLRTSTQSSEQFGAVSEPQLQTERALTEVKRLLLLGRWQPGETLNGRALAEEIGVSRTPLREALRELTAQGVLVHRPGVGTSVVALTEQERSDMLELRILHEGRAIAWAIERATDGVLRDLVTAGCEVDALTREFRAAEREGDATDEVTDKWLQLHQAELRFHRGLVQAAQSAPLLRAWESYYVVLEVLLAIEKAARAEPFVQPNESEEPEHLHLHERLAEAMCSRSLERAEEAFRAHLWWAHPDAEFYK